MFKKAIWGLVVGGAFVVVGCAQQRTAQELAEIQQRCDVSADLRFSSLRGKVPLNSIEGTTPPTVRQIDDNSKPTPEQREALLTLDETWAPCRQAQIQYESRHYPADIVGLDRELQLAVTNLRRLLINGAISFGQFNNNRYQLYAQGQQIAGQIMRAQRMANAAAQQAAATQYSATLQALQAFNRQPTVTTCSRLGNMINCSSN
ncbi:MAG: hypothetical protein IKE60_01875 [Reyranella sp.]|jgi:hypothetical protein|uniref:hypothetical protein n=1 Tax=Reyranella sp. TaxID=1929291 RepID=UPI0025E63FAE|nr:hypothetical protein [Reyranella sp.]MBR2813371.1 hypothetical protein [Reyranella sp.]